ncbi:TonB-dependent receptor family protein [Sphingomonas cavernae]|uniref:TonB-dependent receptor n=1 Tax=Sphingomonas cavernae TaxID=2320861 RepID=A0A418W7V9_9SPHN|nr:TonB-dependent receptor [Sphingomonas cavernae]RJF86088.1 TonB-dependent receptor [Sphingomonas cavernae]
MTSLIRALSGASLIAFIVPAPAFADDTGPIVVTGQKIEEAAAEVARTSGGADTVAAPEYEDKVAVSLRDALAFSPGVYAQPRFGQEVRLSIRGSGISRGFHMRGLTLLQDGIPINLADNNGDFQELDPQIFQHIEVYRGSNALRFGSSTLGGGINAVTPTGRTASGFELRVDGGSFDTIRTKAAAGYADDRADVWAAITTDRSDGDRMHASRDSLRFNGNVGLRLSDTAETRFYATLSHIDQDLPGALTLTDALTNPRKSNAINIVQDQERDIDSIRLQNRTTLDLGSGTLEGGVFYSGKDLFHPIFQVIDQKSEDYGAYARLDLSGAIGGVAVEGLLGTTARFGHVDARQFVNVGGNRGAPTSFARQEAQTIDSYAELRVKPVATLSLIAGGVYTHGERTIDNRTNPLLSGSASFDTFAPKFGVLFEPLAAVQLYANYSRSAELPGYNELAQTQVGGLTGFVDLDPQRAWTFELGTRGTVGIASWDVTLYRSDIKGELLQYSVVPGVIPASTFNADRTRHQGIEAGLDLRLAPFATLRQVYQLNDFAFRNDAVYRDNRLPVIPKHLYRADLRLGTDRFAITPNIEWAPTGAWADYVNSTRAPGYTMFGLGAEANIREGLTLFFDARNLTGEKAIGDISAVVVATPASAIYYPVERRAFYGGVRARF